MRKLAVHAVELLDALKLNEAAGDVEFIRTCSELADIKYDTVRARANFYGKLDLETLTHYMPTEPRVQSLSHFIALLTDLPPRWIFDCATNRRGYASGAEIIEKEKI